MKRQDPAAQLASAPRDVRASMLAAETLAPGAAAVVGRFFAAVAAHGESIDAPSRRSFDAAAASEPTLATLLRALAAHAPRVCLAGGREARAVWYARRRQADPPRRRGPAPLPAAPPEAWPVEWARLYPALRAAPIQESSRRRCVNSVSRIVALLPMDLDLDWSRFTACSLFEALLEAGLHPITAGNYLDGLICLGRHARLDKNALKGLREMRTVAQVRAARIDKKKVARLADLEERGGFMAIAAVIGRLQTEAAAQPANTAAAERLRQTAAVLAVVINAFGRTGDVARWRLGTDLVREPWWAWRLGWTQGKTVKDQNVGELWPEVGEVLDALILGGRPTRFAGLRYSALVGRNWLTLTDDARASRLPSQLVKEAIDVPLHDLRTLLADFLRRVGPARAADLIKAMLGHGSVLSGESYRAGCEGDAAALEWRGIRTTIAVHGVSA